MEILEGITFESWIAMTTKPIFIAMSIVIWMFCILVYILIGALVSGGGKYYKKTMIEYPNFWYAFILWFFIYPTLYLLTIIYPIWLNWFK